MKWRSVRFIAPAVGLVIIVALTAALTLEVSRRGVAHDASSATSDLSMSPYVFTKTVIDALGLVEAARSSTTEIDDSADLYTTVGQFLLEARRTSMQLDRAAGMMDTFASSSDPRISASAENLRATFANLSAHIEAMAVAQENLLQAETNDDLVAFMSTNSKVLAAIDSTWKALPIATAGLTYALIDTEEVSDGHFGYLRITSAERAQLIVQLETMFGRQIEGGLQTGQHAVVASAALLREFLLKEWRAADEHP